MTFRQFSTALSHAKSRLSVLVASLEARSAINTFGGEVKGCRSAASLVTPVDSALSVSVLVVVEHAIGVLAGVPVLSKGHERHSAIDVLPYCFTSCTASSHEHHWMMECHTIWAPPSLHVPLIS